MERVLGLEMGEGGCESKCHDMDEGKRGWRGKGGRERRGGRGAIRLGDGEGRSKWLDMEEGREG
jgi:hypothetical protein